MMRKTDVFVKYVLVILIGLSLISLPVMAEKEYCRGADTQAPTVPKGLTATDRTHTSISLSWTDSCDNVSVKGYQIYRDGKKIGTTSKTTYINSNLIPGKQYAYSVRAYDAAGNVSDSSTILNAETINDVKSPEPPGSLKASSVTFTSVSLTWKPSTDDIGIKGYEIYCNDKKAASTADAAYEYKKLTPGNTYTFYVKAYDKAGNCSLQSNRISFNTLSDKTVPSPPAELKATFVSITEVNLTWSPASDNVKVRGYDIIRDGIKIGTTSKTSYVSKNLFPGKSYTYTIRASDISGNLSGSSSPLSVTTLKDLQAPAAPSNLKVNTVKGASVSLSWTAPADNGKIGGYQIYCNSIVIATSTTASHTVKNPFAPGCYEFWVKAYDQSGNLSASSNTITADTPAE